MRQLILILLLFIGIPASNSFLCEPKCLSCNSINQYCQLCPTLTSAFIDGSCRKILSEIKACKVYSQPLICQVCHENFTLQNNMCIDQIQNCSLYLNQTCILCSDSFDLVNGECLPKRQLKTSRLLISGCIEIDSISSHCIQCLPGLTVSKGSCVISNCKQYESPTVCSKCIQNYKLINFQCVLINQITHCPFGQKLNNQGVCIIENCATTSIPCDLCINSYILNSQGKCYPSIQNCIVFKDDGGCLMCKKQYIYNNNNNQCVLTRNPPFNCLLYTINLICQSCQLNYVLDHKSGNCFPENSIIQNCYRYNINYKCVQCQKGYLLHNKFCLPHNTQKNNPNTNNIVHTAPSIITIKPILIENCLKQDGKSLQCIKCQKQFALISNLCIPVNRVITHCLKYNPKNHNCLNCTPKYELLYNFCVHEDSVVKNCKHYDPTTYHCRSCIQNYEIITLDNSLMCILQQDITSNCIKYINNNNQIQCVACSSKYKQINGNCINKSKIIENCLSYVKDTNECAGCIKNWTLINHVCVNNDYIVTGCIYYENEICKTCKVGTSLVHGNCMPTQYLVTNCTKYDKEYFCLACEKQTTLISTNNICLNQDNIIQNCQSYTQSLACEKCVVDSKLFSGFCVAKQNIIENCISYNENYKCVGCSIQYELKNHFCEKQKQVTSKIDKKEPVKDIKITTTTLEPCKTWQSKNKCKECIKGYILKDQTCKAQTSVPSKPVPSQINKIITPFVKIHPTQTKSGESVKKQHKSLQIKIVSPPQGIAEVKNTKIIPNDPNCKTKNTAGFCTSCYLGWYLSSKGTCFNNLCLQKIPQTVLCKKCIQGFILINGVCTDHSSLCKNHSTDGKCFQCYKGYFLKNSICQYYEEKDPYCIDQNSQKVCIACSDRYYVLHGVCKPVDNNCNTYNKSNGSCESCHPNYIVHGGKCVYINNSIPQCILYEQKTCKKCSKTKKLVNGICV